MMAISIMYNGKDHQTINSLSAIASSSYNQNNAFMIKMYISRENKEKEDDNLKARLIDLIQ